MFLCVQVDSSQIAVNLMQIRDWSQQIMSTLEQLDEQADPVSNP